MEFNTKLSIIFYIGIIGLPLSLWHLYCIVSGKYLLHVSMIIHLILVPIAIYMLFSLTHDIKIIKKNKRE